MGGVSLGCMRGMVRVMRPSDMRCVRCSLDLSGLS